MSKNNSTSLSSTLKTIFRMWGYAKPWKFRFYFGFLMGCTMPLYFSILFSMILKQFLKVCMSGDINQLRSVFIYIGAIMLFGIVIYPLCFGMIYTTFSYICGNIQKKVFIHAQSLPVAYTESKYSGDIVSRVTTDYNDALQLVAYPTVGQNNPFARALTVFVTAIIVLCNNWILGCASLVLGVAGMLFTSSFAKPIKIAEVKTKEISAKAAQNVINTLSGTRVARMFGLDDYLKKIYEESTEAIYKNNLTLVGKKALMGATSEFQSFLSFTGVTAFGLWLSTHRIIDIPTVIFIASIQIGMANGLANLGQAFGNIQRYVAGAERLFEFFDTPLEDSRESIAAPDFTADKAIEIENLWFNYMGSSKKIFKGFNLEVENGKSLAIVGGSGGGKSTLFKLLLNFADKNKGDIKVFGNSMEQYSLKDLRSLFSYVPQDSYLFDASIKENIAWGNPAASEEEIIKAAKDAYLHDFIMSLPDGYNTRVGERGAQISGGQKQRIAIARAFIKNAPIILLDEATSSLDSESELEVQKALEGLMENRTTIIIAHRLSTIQNADRIIVLEQGQNIEEGTHEELISKNSRYAELYNMQYV